MFGPLDFNPQKILAIHVPAPASLLHMAYGIRLRQASAFVSSSLEVVVFLL